ncbi:MAG: RICIN domain-containing protein [Thermoguttaceae bacterium]|jgi:hypothetical protein
MRPSGILFSFGLVILAALSAVAQEAEKKLPVPDAKAQAEATKLVREVYGDEYSSAKSAEQKKTLAKKLIQKASETKDDSASKFVLLKIAKDVATQALDGQTTFQAIDNMAESFQTNSLEMKVAVLTVFAKKASTAADHKSLAEQSLVLTDQAVASDDFDLARHFGDLLLAEARAGRDPQSLRAAQERIARVEAIAEAYKEMQTATKALAQKPSDPEASLIVGKYRCFYKGDWEKGLPMLAKGADEKLKTLAKQDIDGASTASSADKVKLGDAWWDTAGENATAKTIIQGRAAYWYQKALPELTGLARDKADKRLRSLPPRAPTSSGGSAQPWVRIVNRNSGMYLCIRNGGEAGEGTVVQHPLLQDSLDNQWRVDKPQGFCWIINRKIGNCLAVSEGKKTSGHPVIVWPKYQDGLEQQWQIRPLPHGHCLVVNRNSGMCLSIAEASRSAGAIACQSPFAGAKAFGQQWRIDIVPQDDANKPR